MREFEKYLESKQKHMRVLHLEVVWIGFKKAWQECDYAKIIAVARKVPKKTSRRILNSSCGTTKHSQEWEQNSHDYQMEGL